MSHLTRLFANALAVFCAHEWARRVEGRRVYLECVHCLATTPGFDLGPAKKTTTKPGRRALETVEAS